jgi:hypothetical protein
MIDGSGTVYDLLLMDPDADPEAKKHMDPTNPDSQH